MNFLEGKPYAADKARIKCVAVIKFTSNVHFSIDGECVKKEITAEFGNLEDTNRFYGEGTVVDVMTGEQITERFSLVFKGFFRQSVEGKLVIAPTVHPKDFDKYDRLKPYLLVFYYDSLREKE